MQYLTEHKSLDAIKYVPTEPWNLVDTIVVYSTIEFVLFFSKFLNLSWQIYFKIIMSLKFGNFQVVYGTDEFVLVFSKF